MLPDEHHPIDPAAAEPHQKIQHPEATCIDQSARNATTHGLCAETLILPYEDENACHPLLHSWLNECQPPAETFILYTFILYTFIHKTARAEWQRRRTPLPARISPPRTPLESPSQTRPGSQKRYQKYRTRTDRQLAGSSVHQQRNR